MGRECAVLSVTDWLQKCSGLEGTGGGVLVWGTRPTYIAERAIFVANFAPFWYRHNKPRCDTPFGTAEEGRKCYICTPVRCVRRE